MYRHDVRTRAALLEVLTKILQQGGTGGACFDTLTDSVSTERFQRLVELVTMLGDNGELPIANALANVVLTNYLVGCCYNFLLNNCTCFYFKSFSL